jgi:hypothetical protein
MYCPTSGIANVPPRSNHKCVRRNFGNAAIAKTQLVVATPAASTASAAISTSAATTAAEAVSAAATGFLLARFIYLQRTASNIQSIHFSDGFRGITIVTEFDEAEAAGPARLAIGDDAGGTDLVTLIGKEL